MPGGKSSNILLVALLWGLFLGLAPAFSSDIAVGAYYMPGWQPGSSFWADLKGAPGSRSPNVPWPERKPLLGYYPEGEVWVAEEQLKWAREAGLSFFVYNWYWLYRKGPYLEHALRAYLRARGRKGVKFALLWVNHPPFDISAREWERILAYWEKNFLSRPEYFRLHGRLPLFIFDPYGLRRVLGGWREVARVLARFKEKGLMPVACLAGPPAYDALGLAVLEGYEAVSAYNYVEATGPRVDTYDHLVEAYRRIWAAYLDYLREFNAFLAGKKAPKLEEVLARYAEDPRWQEAIRAFRRLKGSGRRLSYIVPVIPGWDERPLKGQRAFVRVGSTPAKFKKMLIAARHFVEENAKSGLVERVVLIEAWNEFAEGSYIEPTVAWGKAYLEVVKEVFGDP